MSTPVAVLRIDTSGTAFGATPTWTDRTSYLMSGSQYPVEITRGRSDERADVDPATCSFYLKNDTGFWSPGNAAAPANWKVGCPVNVRLTHASVTYDRFTGHVDSIEPTWPGGVQSWSVVKVTATDVSSRLGFAQPLLSMLQEEINADNPVYFFSLSEPAGATSCADISGATFNPIARVVNTAAGAWPLTFGVETGLLEGATGVNFGAYNSTTKASVLSLPRFTENHSLELWFVAPTSAPATPVILRKATNHNGTVHATLRILSTGVLSWTVLDVEGDTYTISTTESICDGGLHQAVVTANINSTRLIVDGVVVELFGDASSYFIADYIDRDEIGGTTSSPSGSTFPGVITHVALFTGSLSAARALAHYQAGIGTGPLERSDQRFSRIAAFGGITTSGLPTGQAMMSGQNTAGVTAVDALALVARTEGTVDYATGAGALTFQARDFRYQKAVGLALTASDIDPGFMPRQDRQGQFNELAVTRAGGASQVAKNTAAQTADGRRDGGSFEVAPSTDEDAFQGASWQVANHKDPQMRLPDLTVNLLARSDAITTSCLAADISTVVQVTSLPSNAPATTVTQFIEGWTERISVNDWRMSFFTSPVVLEDDVLVLDSATKGLLDTNVLAF